MSDLPQVTESVQPTPGGAFGGSPMTPRAAKRLAAFGTVVVVLFGILLMRLWFLQVVGANNAQAQASANSVRTVILPAPRGEIVDRNGVALALNRDAWDLVGIPKDLDTTEGHQTVARLARLLGADNARLQELITSRAATPRGRFLPILLKDDIDEKGDLFSALNERMSEFPGVQLVRSSKRVYPDQQYISHVIGSVGKIQENQVEAMRQRGYRLDATVGNSGLEKRYEDYLRGADGTRKVEVDASGKATDRGIVSEKPAKPGLTLETSIDIEVQRELANSLRWKVLLNGQRDSGAGGVVIDIETGEVIALDSYPILDPKLLNGNHKGKSWKLYKARHPEFNRAVAAYPPGSTFKPVTALAALNEGVLTADERIEAKKKVTLHGTQFTNFRLTYQGFLNLTEAITMSSDTYFYEVGDRIWGAADAANRASGHTALWKWSKALGYGAPTGIDLVPGEWPSVLPDRLWRAQNNPPGSEIGWNQWRPGDSINMSVGQGDFRASPLQMARAYAALLDPQHRLLTPTIGMRVVDPTSQDTIADLEKGRAQTILPEIKPGVMEPIMAGMQGVTSSSLGTAQNVFGGMSGLIAGKTGTAQAGGKNTPDHSWFVGYGPTGPGRTPKYVVAIVVEKSGLGGNVAAPVACRVMAKALQIDPGKCGSGAVRPGTAG